MTIEQIREMAKSHTCFLCGESAYDMSPYEYWTCESCYRRDFWTFTTDYS